MTARSLADVLISFEAREAVVVTATREEPVATGAAPEDAEERREREIAAAREAGYAEGLESAAADRAAALETQRGEFAARLVAERGRWACDEGRALAEKLACGLDEIETRIAARIAKILRGFVAERLSERATRELAHHVRTLLSGADGKVVVVTGQEDLLAALRARLGDVAAAVDFRPGTAAEACAVCDDSLVESRLSAWLARLAEPVE